MKIERNSRLLKSLFLLLAILSIPVGYGIYDIYKRRYVGLRPKITTVVFPSLPSDDDIMKLSDEAVRRAVPAALAFKEPLLKSVKPEEIIVWSGSDRPHDKGGFRQTNWDQMRKMCDHHGYKMVHIMSVDFDRSLSYNGVKFAPYWYRNFALSPLRAAYPNAKYFVWLDDDVTVPYPQSDIINHFINIMEADSKLHYIFPQDHPWSPSNAFCAGLHFVRNSDWTQQFNQLVIEKGLVNGGYLAREQYHEQTALNRLRVELGLERHILVVPKNRWPYYVNSYNYELAWDHALIHMGGDPADYRDKLSAEAVHGAEQYVARLSKRVVLPVHIETQPSAPKGTGK